MSFLGVIFARSNCSVEALYTYASVCRDGDDIKVFLLEGYLDLKCVFSGYIYSPGEEPFAACAALSDICALNASVAGSGVDSIDCRLGMADAFDTEFTLRKASGNSTDVPDLPVCLTDLGLGNGAINMVAGMLIVSATVLLGVVEQISGMYALRDVKSAVVVGVMIMFHILLACTLLVASRRRIATVAVSADLVSFPCLMSYQLTVRLWLLQNEFWDVMEASVTVFLVTELDDLVLYCVKRHPVVHSALVSLRIRRITDATVLADPSVTPCSAELFVQSRAEVSRQKESLRARWGHSESLAQLRKLAEEVRVPKDILDAAFNTDREYCVLDVVLSRKCR